VHLVKQFSLDEKMLKYSLLEQYEPTTVFYHNNSTIILSKNRVFHKKTKHIDTMYYFTRELVNNKEICVEFCMSKEKLRTYLQEL